MKQGLITVVLPIYNVEQYLERCLESVVNQTYKNLEIILVDDGSPDHCPEMCDEWAKKDKRIKVIHKKNAGLGFARNTGIENATGEYICFFDSDDYIALDAIEKVYNLAEKEQAEIVTFGFFSVKSNGEIRKELIPCPRKLVYERNEVQEEFLPNLIGPNTSTGEFTNLWMSVCGALYSMQLIQHTNWRLVSEREIISEDVYSLLRLYKSVNKVAILPDALYYYCENATSLSHTYKQDRYERIKHFYSECQKACDELGYCDAVKKRLAYPFASNTIAALKMISNANCNKLEKRESIYAILKDRKLNEIITNMDIKYEKKQRKALMLAIKYRIYWLAKIMVMIKA